MEFDLVIIGSGPGGYVGAIRAAQLGLKTAIIEKDKDLGGTCLNVGCIPSKALLESSEHYEFTKKDLSQHGVETSSLKLNLQNMIKRKENIVSELNKGVAFLLKKNKVTSFHGWGSIKSPYEVLITSENKTETIKAKHIVLASGSTPIELPFAKWSDRIVSSTEALSFNEVPKKLIVIGGGYIGLELGSVWKRLGSEVIVIERSASICPTMDVSIQKKFYDILKKQGLQFHLGSEVKEVKSKTGKVTFIDSNKKTEVTYGDKILVCVGRKSFSKNLGLEQVNLAVNSVGQVDVNANFQTSVPHIYAIGDLIRGPMLAHKAEEEGVAVAEIIANQWGHVNYNTVPSVVYTHPEVASVGKTEQELKQEAVPYKQGQFPFSANGRAKALGSTEGFVKVLAHKETDKILGVHILGPRAGDLISEAVIAMEFQGSSEDVARSFHAHPTLSETMREACLNVQDRARQM